LNSFAMPKHLAFPLAAKSKRRKYQNDVRETEGRALAEQNYGTEWGALQRSRNRRSFYNKRFLPLCRAAGGQTPPIGIVSKTAFYRPELRMRENVCAIHQVREAAQRQPFKDFCGWT
jgi:hypothetical protein